MFFFFFWEKIKEKKGKINQPEEGEGQMGNFPSKANFFFYSHFFPNLERKKNPLWPNKHLNYFLSYFPLSLQISNHAYFSLQHVTPTKHSLPVIVMQDAKTSRSRTCLFLENKKQNMFASKTNLESTRIVKSTRRNGLEFTRK